MIAGAILLVAVLCVNLADLEIARKAEKRGRYKRSAISTWRNAPDFADPTLKKFAKTFAVLGPLGFAGAIAGIALSYTVNSQLAWLAVIGYLIAGAAQLFAAWSQTYAALPGAGPPRSA